MRVPSRARSRPAGRRPPPGRPSSRGRRPRWGLRIVTGASALVLLASGVGHALVVGLEGGLRRLDPFAGLTGRPAASDGLNFLVVGVDDRHELSEEQRQRHRLGGESCDCTDTLMLVHVSEDRERLSVVSIPRDSFVRLPPHTDPGTGKHHRAVPAKINSAYAHGGPHLTVRTVEDLTGVHVDHYLEVDFSSFLRTVDVLGGVPVCTTKPLRDPYSGLDLPAGASTLDGAQALAYVRARHLGGDSDFGRMRRQQRFIAAVLDKATEGEVLANPVKFHEVTRTLLDSVRADEGFGTSEMVALGKAMRDFDPGSAEFVSVPVADPDHRVRGLGSTVRWDRREARRLFGALRDDRPLAPGNSHRDARPDDSGPADGPGGSRGAEPGGVEVPPEHVRVQVENGTHRAGLGHRVDQALRAAGFRTTGIPRNAARQDHRHTVVTYDPGWDRSVRTVQAAFPDAELRPEAGRGPTMTVTLGRDFDRVHAVRTDGPAPGPAGGPGRTDREFRVVTGDHATCD